jgi:hypothetical protein
MWISWWHENWQERPVSSTLPTTNPTCSGTTSALLQLTIYPATSTQLGPGTVGEGCVASCGLSGRIRVLSAGGRQVAGSQSAVRLSDALSGAVAQGEHCRLLSSFFLPFSSSFPYSFFSLSFFLHLSDCLSFLLSSFPSFFSTSSFFFLAFFTLFISSFLFPFFPYSVFFFRPFSILFSFFSLSICLSICLSVSLSFFLPSFLYFILFCSVSVALFALSFISLSMYISLYLSNHLSLFPSPPYFLPFSILSLLLSSVFPFAHWPTLARVCCAPPARWRLLTTAYRCASGVWYLSTLSVIGTT